DATLVYYSGYSDQELAPCANMLVEYLKKPLKYDSLYKKYTTKKFMKVSPWVKVWISKTQMPLHQGASDDEDDSQL
ncbi:hypothetical protein BDK51DRAFT_15661, partial [Blyttiomyces helicus]